MSVAEAPVKRKTRGGRVIKFIEQHCVYSDGPWIGKPAQLLPWQKQFLYELFEIDPETHRRRYRWCLLGVPKKNGKSQLIAWLGLYFLLADGEPAPLVVVAAASEEQADLVYGMAKTCCEMSPTLSQMVEPWEKEILVPSSPGAKLQRLAASAGTNDGKNIHVVICDELHEWTGHKGRAVWNVLTNGQGARQQPMVLQITTAGWDDETICNQEYQYGKQVQNGEIDDDAYYFRWYEPSDPNADHRNPAVWEEANPSFGVTVHEAFLENQIAKKTEGVFRRYFLNQWTASEEVWLEHGAWEACVIPGVDLVDGEPTYVGVDASTKHDATAVVAGQWIDDRLVLKAWIWEPPVDRGSGQPIDGWQMPEDELEALLRELYSRYELQVVASDMAWVRRMMQQLELEGWPVLEVPQTAKRMVPATQTLHEMIKNQEVAHDGDPAFARHIKGAAVIQVSGGDGGFRLSKGRARKANDAAICAAIVAHEATQPAEAEPEAPNIW